MIYSTMLDRKCLVKLSLCKHNETLKDLFWKRIIIKSHNKTFYTLQSSDLKQERTVSNKPNHIFNKTVQI